MVTGRHGGAGEFGRASAIFSWPGSRPGRLALARAGSAGYAGFLGLHETPLRMSFSRLLRWLAHLLFLLPVAAFACTGAVNIEIRHSGLYALDYQDLAAQQPGLAGCPVADLVLENRGKPVPLRMIDNGDGRFGSDDRLEWIGDHLRGPQSWFDSYSTNNVYLLSARPGPHARITDLPAPPADAATAALTRTLHLEQENLMIRLDQRQHKPGEEPDLWQWAKLTHADPEPFKTEFDLPDVDVRAGAATLRLNFRGISNIARSYDPKYEPMPDHMVEIRLNGELLKRASWDGRDEVAEHLEVRSALLKPTGNALTLSVPKRPVAWQSGFDAVDVIMFNWIEFDYALAGHLAAEAPPLGASGGNSQAIAVTWQGEGAPPALTGDDGYRRLPETSGGARVRYAAAKEGVTLYAADRFQTPVAVRAHGAADWHAPAAGYDYLIVSHPSLIEAIEPLAEFHRKRGMRVAVIDIDAVYDEFNFGITHPRAVRNLVDHAWHNWPQPRPRFLLLVGDASFDIGHDTYNDLAYAKFANHPQELLPGQFSGIPATTYEEVGEHTGVRNLIPTWQYPSPEGQSASDNWFGAVDGDDYHPVVAVGRFPVTKPAEVSAIVEKTINYMTRPQPGIWRRDVMFITDESAHFKKASDEIASTIGQKGFIADKIYASPEEADNLAHQSAIKDGLNAGQLLVHFIGHGGRYIWRTGPPDLRKNHDLFTLDDVSDLENGGRLPMILSMTCYSAPFDNPTEDSIGERFLREADKGAVAVFAASWRNAPSTAFSTSLVKELLEPGATIGEAIVAAKKSIKDRTLVEMYNLLGDPAVVLERPRADARMQRSSDAWKPAVLVSLPGPRFHGLVAVDWLDEARELISTTVHRSEQVAFSLPIPAFAEGKTAHYARLYANNELSGLDATAGLDLTAYVEPAGTGWRDWLGFGESAAPADTIMRHYFDRAVPSPSGED